MLLLLLLAFLSVQAVPVPREAGHGRWPRRQMIASRDLVSVQVDRRRSRCREIEHVRQHVAGTDSSGFVDVCLISLITDRDQRVTGDIQVLHP